MSYSRPTITLNEGPESNNNNHHDTNQPSNNNHHHQSNNSLLSSSTKPSSHSTVSNTPNPTATTTTTTSNSSSTNQSPAGIHRTTSNTVTTTTASKQTLLQQQQPNVVGKIKHPDPILPPLRLTTTPTITPQQQQQNQQQQSIDYVAIKNATLTRTYPTLSPNIFLLTPDGRLKPSSERERVFQDLEARIVSLKAKCGEIVKGAKALHRACNAVVQLNQNGGNNGTALAQSVNGGGGGGSHGLGPSIQFGGAGAGVSKKRANGSASALMVVSGSTGNVALKEKLKEELNRLVGEGRRLRESIEASPFLDGKPMS